MIDLTPVAVSVITLCCVVVTVKVIPWIKANVSKEKREEIAYWADFAVNAAEKLADKGTINKKDKYRYVEEFLHKKGFGLSIGEIEVLIEAFCNKLPDMIVGELISTDEIPSSEDINPTESVESN